MPDDFTTRQFEKGVLKRIFEERCSPDEHHPDCPRRPQVCPYA